MFCPKCGGDTRTIDSRDTDDGRRRRKRICKECGYSFMTFEFTAVDLAKLTSTKREAEMN